MLDVEERTELAGTNTGEHDRFKHYVLKKTLKAGMVCKALCGKVWLPNANPDNYPVCPTCDEIYQRIRK